MLGICDGVQTFLTGNSIANSDIVLTYDIDLRRSTDRRNAACGSQACTPLQNQLKAQFGDPSIEVPSDEFPFASAEEGRSYLSTIPINPT